MRAYCRLKIEGILHKFRGGIFFQVGEEASVGGRLFRGILKSEEEKVGN